MSLRSLFCAVGLATFGAFAPCPVIAGFAFLFAAVFAVDAFTDLSVPD